MSLGLQGPSGKGPPVRKEEDRDVAIRLSPRGKEENTVCHEEFNSVRECLCSFVGRGWIEELRASLGVCSTTLVRSPLLSAGDGILLFLARLSPSWLGFDSARVGWCAMVRFRRQERVVWQSQRSRGNRGDTVRVIRMRRDWSRFGDKGFGVEESW